MNEWPWPSNAEAIRAFRDSAIPPFPPGFLPAPGKPDAAATADALLQERLGARAYALFQETGRLMRPSRLWRGVEYRLQRNEPVRVIQAGQTVASLCVVARHGEPEADRLLTILDLIETDERRLWEMGNLTDAGRPPSPDRPPGGPVVYLCRFESYPWVVALVLLAFLSAALVAVAWLMS